VGRRARHAHPAQQPSGVARDTCFLPQPKLHELSLSFNTFCMLDAEAFTDMGGTLQSLEISFGLTPSM
jgi:hypothetical protein